MNVETLALRLREAYKSGPVAPLRDGLEPQDATSAYSVQSFNTRFWLDSGRRMVGRKIGLTAKAVQKQLGVDQPDYGALFADMYVEDGSELSASRLIQPRVEAEVALVLAADLDNPQATAHDVMRATAYAVPSIEIVDSRIAQWKISFADTVADNGSAGAFVLGREPKLLTDLDLRTCGMVLEINGSVSSVGSGAACLGHPLNSAAWLVRTLSTLGEPLKSGDVILTGALGPMVDIAPGSSVRASIGGLGSCAFTFIQAEC